MKMIHSQQPQIHVQQKQVWRCDICRVRTFPTFQEACDHEAVCTKRNTRSAASIEVDSDGDKVVVVGTSPSPSSPFCSSIDTPYSSSQDTTTEAHPSAVIHRIRNVANKTPNHKHACIDLTDTNTNTYNISNVKHLQQPAVSTETVQTTRKRTKREVPKVSNVSVIIGGKRACVLKAVSPTLVRNVSSSPSRSTTCKQTRDVTEKDSERGHLLVPSIQMNKSKPNKSKKCDSTSNTNKTAVTSSTAAGSSKRGGKSRPTDTNKITAPSSRCTKTMKGWLILSEGNRNVIDVDNDSDRVEENCNQFICEQVVAYKFMEARRKKRQLEHEKNERQKKRQQRETAVTTIISVSDRSKHGSFIGSMISDSVQHAAAVDAIRFPIPSHIIQSTNEWNNSTMFVPTQPLQQQQHHWWNLKTPQFQLCQGHSCLYSTKRKRLIVDKGSLSLVDCRYESLDLLQETIRRFIVPPNNTKSSSTSSSSLVQQYYYGNLFDFTMSTSLSGASKHLQNFVERFMLERQKVERATKEKQQKQRQMFFGIKKPKEKSNPTTSKRSNKYYSDDDDYLWDDDNDCSNSNLNESDLYTSSLCVISGPVGCGKSNLVHRIAKQLGCRKVVELHTGMKRNAATMKRIIEEATKSHSTFDMIQNKKDVEKIDEEVSLSDQILDDRGSAVTVILIDEVDNLDPSTDLGFWTALCDLYRESKCPIILTCNRIPNELRSASFRWTHVPIERPSSSECSKQLQEILFHEGFLLRDFNTSYNSDTADPLSTIATLANCDMRRVLLELQLLSVLSPSLHVSQSMNDVVDTTTPSSCLNFQSFPEYNPPKIEMVIPNFIHLEQYSCITISGSNFLDLIDTTCKSSTTYHGYPCIVTIGENKCPAAQIVSNTTILAVVAPFSWQSARKAETGSFLPVNLCCSKPLGLISTTNTAVAAVDLLDQTRLLISSPPYLIEYRHHRIDASGSDDENEFDIKGETPLYSVTSVDNDIVSQLLRESVDFWVTKNGKVDSLASPVLTPVRESTTAKVQQLDDAYTKASLSSDSALLDHFGVHETLVLSGACRGYGFDYTEDFPRRTNENSKPPSEEHLILSGCKEDANFYGSCDSFMVRYISRREQKLLLESEYSIRGRAPTYGGIHFEDDEADKYREPATHQSAEDCLACVSAPASLQDLPHLLNPSCKSFTRSLNTELWNRRRKSRRDEVVDFLGNYFTHPKQTCYFGKLQKASSDYYLGQMNILDYDIFLDYLPMLRCMAVQEVISESVYDCSAANDSRPNTRRSKRTGRENYFDKVFQSQSQQLFKGDQSTKDIVKILYGMSLCIVHSHKNPV